MKDEIIEKLEGLIQLRRFDFGNDHSSWIRFRVRLGEAIYELKSGLIMSEDAFYQLIELESLRTERLKN